jgi:hypothetical protein
MPRMTTHFNRFSTGSTTPGVTHWWLSFAGIGVVAVTVCLLAACVFAATSVEVHSLPVSAVDPAPPCENAMPDSTGLYGVDDKSGCTVEPASALGVAPAEDRVASRRAVELRWSIDAAGYQANSWRGLAMNLPAKCRASRSILAASVGNPTLVSLGIRLQT